MASGRRLDFGYNPPTGDRGWERIDPRTFLADLQQVLDVACQHFDSFWVSDHHQFGNTFRLECWTQLNWMAARYPTQGLGTVVMCNSYRHPPLLAKMAASLQYFSSGRFVLGYGAGWAEEEYHAYGYEFPRPAVRIAQLVEGIRVIKALWTQAPANFEGTYYSLKDAYCEPRPDPVPPIMIGGDGEQLLLRAVAELGDWWFPFSRPIPQLRHKIEVLQRHCREVGRDYAGIRKAYTLIAFLDRSRTAAEARAGATLQREMPPFAGEPEALVERIQELVDLGFEVFHLVFPGFPETDDLRLFVDRVLPAFR
jgi:alkanesulfonate monooxygenase SsuD/methylene tetrahydromethanopterin reductase-like flavin-dependent oxidoreductase (luciferase family)